MSGPNGWIILDKPLGLGSIVLKVRHNLCADCNRCAISIACPKDAIVQQPVPTALEPTLAHRPEQP